RSETWATTPQTLTDHASTIPSGSRGLSPGDPRQLLDKHAVEKLVCLDITTLYRKMRAGTFPQPVRIGRRRVAWRMADIMQWQQGLEVGTETARRRAANSSGKDPDSGRGGRRGPR